MRSAAGRRRCRRRSDRSRAGSLTSKAPRAEKRLSRGTKILGAVKSSVQSALPLRNHRGTILVRWECWSSRITLSWRRRSRRPAARGDGRRPRERRCERPRATPESMNTTWSCSTETCRGSTATRSARSSGERRSRPGADADRVGRESRTASAASASGPTTTCRSRSRSPSWSLASGRSRAVRSRRSPRSSSHDDLELDTARRVARRGGPARAERQGARRARAAARRPGRRGLGRRAARARLGRGRRPVQQRRQGDGQPPAPQARRPTADRDGPRWRLPDLSAADASPHFGPRRSVTLRLRLTLLYGACFLVAGAALLGITYALVARDESTTSDLRGAWRHAQPVSAAGPPFPAVAGAWACAVRSRGPWSSRSRRCRRPAQGFRARSCASSHDAGPEQLNARHAARELCSQSAALDTPSLAAERPGSRWRSWRCCRSASGWLLAGRALRPLRTMNTARTGDHRGEPARAARSRVSPRRARRAGRHLRRAAGAARAAFDVAAAVRRQRVARAPHAADARADAGRGRARRSRTRRSESLRRVCERVLAATEQQERLIDALLTLARSQAGVEAIRSIRSGRRRRGPDRRAGVRARRDQVETDLDPAADRRRRRPGRASGREPDRQRDRAQRGRAAVDPRRRPERRRSPRPRVANSGAGDPSRIRSPSLFEPFRRLDGDRTGGRRAALDSACRSSVRSQRHTAPASKRRPLPDGGLELELASSGAPGGGRPRRDRSHLNSRRRRCHPPASPRRSGSRSSTMTQGLHDGDRRRFAALNWEREVFTYAPGTGPARGAAAPRPRAWTRRWLASTTSSGSRSLLPGLALLVVAGRCRSPIAFAACAEGPTTGSRSRATRRSSSPGSRRYSGAGGSGITSVDDEPVIAGDLTIRPDRFDAYAGDEAADCRARSSSCFDISRPPTGGCLSARDLPARLGLHDGARRPLRRRVRPQAPQEARADLAEWRYLHTHFGVGYRFAAERSGDAPTGDGASTSREGTPASRRAYHRSHRGTLSDLCRSTSGLHVDSNKDPSEHPDHRRDRDVWLTLLPHGGTVASVIWQLISLSFLALIAFISARLYQEHRVTIYSLGPKRRAIAYSALGLATLTLTASDRLLVGGAGPWPGCSCSASRPTRCTPSTGSVASTDCAERGARAGQPGAAVIS